MTLSQTGGGRENLVVHMTSVHDPLDVRIFVRQCKTLAAAGYRVAILARGESKVEREIHIHGVGEPRSRMDRMIRTTAAIYWRAREMNAAIYHIHDPELIPVGLLLRLRGKTVIYDAHEELPLDVQTKPWIPRALRGPVGLMARVLEKIVDNTFSAIVAATPTIARRFSPARTVTLLNYPLAEEFTNSIDPTEPIPYPLFVHVGGVHPERGYREIVRAIREVSGSARVAFAGRQGDPALLHELETGQAGDRVDWLGWLDRTRVAQLMGAATCGLALSHPLPNYTESQPNKLFEYMAAGLPVIASDFPLWKELVGGIGCGILVDPLSPDAVADAMQWVVDNPDEARRMGLRGREAVARELNWEAESVKLLKLYARFAGSQRFRRPLAS